MLLYCSAENDQLQRHLALVHGVVALKTKFAASADESFDGAVRELVSRGYLTLEQNVVIVQVSFFRSAPSSF